MNNQGEIPLLDQEQIAMLIDAGGDSARELFDDLERLFIEETQPRLQVIKEALSKQELRTIAKQVHAIAGASANLGGVRLATVCRHLEKQIVDSSAPDVSSISEAIYTLQDLFDQTIAALHARIITL